jgi:hypothetical protein
MKKKIVVEMFLVVLAVALFGYIFGIEEFIENAEVRAVRKKIEAGADVNARDERGETPLHKAVRKGQVKMVRELVRLGADVNARDERGNVPAYWTTVGGKENPEGKEIREFLEKESKKRRIKDE